MNFICQSQLISMCSFSLRRVVSEILSCVELDITLPCSHGMEELFVDIFKLLYQFMLLSRAHADIPLSSSTPSTFCPLHLFPSLLLCSSLSTNILILPPFSPCTLALLVSPPLLSGSANSTTCLTGSISRCSS